MQIDMHYYGTYALARAAGLKRDAAWCVATAAQYVDDNAEGVYVRTRDGGAVLARPTAHHMLDIKNITDQDQRHVWVPFHFLPGNKGTEFTERLICRKDSGPAKEMLAHHLEYADRPYALELLGVTAHVYADTFAHYGFSGVSSRRNQINQKTLVPQLQSKDVLDYITSKASSFFEKVEFCIDNVSALAAEACSGALGHGAAATYPDRPFLKWEMEYEYPEKRKVLRENQKTFLEACEKLHAHFREFAAKRPDLAEPGRSFEEIEKAVRLILAVEGDKDTRSNQWCAASEQGAFGVEEVIPPYAGEEWAKDLKACEKQDNGRALLELPVYRFLLAASMHRHWVLRELLPAQGLMVA